MCMLNPDDAVSDYHRHFRRKIPLLPMSSGDSYSSEGISMKSINLRPGASVLNRPFLY